MQVVLTNQLPYRFTTVDNHLPPPNYPRHVRRVEVQLHETYTTVKRQTARSCKLSFGVGVIVLTYSIPEIKGTQSAIQKDSSPGAECRSGFHVVR